MTANAAQSIYAGPKSAALCPTREVRAARKQRRAARARSLDNNQIRIDRRGPLTAALLEFRRNPESLALARYVNFVQAEVEALEMSAQAMTDRQAGPTIRRALALLRTFGHLTTLNFSSVPEEERGELVRLLALEHRFCYAAAGTTREDFKAATGRTGAR